MERMTLRLLRDWGGFKKGAVIKPKQEMTALLVERLIERGIVERYEKGEDN